MDHDRGELGERERVRERERERERERLSVCVCVCISSLRDTFPRTCQGAVSQMQDGVRSPGESDSGPAIPSSLRSNTRVMLGEGRGCQR
jgi:hypothetical protein